jgi:FKBP-type peptidyl-prolyl cis-trans isomerase SlyD
VAETVSDGQVVLLHYTLSGADGAFIESTAGGAPVAVLVGRGHLVPGLERALLGRTSGDKFEVAVPAADGYGEKSGQGAQPVPRREFPKDAHLVPGMPLRVQDGEGRPVVVWITKVQGAQVWIDIDHPLAGRELRFEVEIAGVRPATSSELEHGHAHGGDGHHHH